MTFIAIVVIIAFLYTVISLYLIRTRKATDHETIIFIFLFNPAFTLINIKMIGLAQILAIFGLSIILSLYKFATYPREKLPLGKIIESKALLFILNSIGFLLLCIGCFFILNAILYNFGSIIVNFTTPNEHRIGDIPGKEMHLKAVYVFAQILAFMLAPFLCKIIYFKKKFKYLNIIIFGITILIFIIFIYNFILKNF